MPQSHRLVLVTVAFAVLAIVVQWILIGKACNTRSWLEFLNSHRERFAGTGGQTIENAIRRGMTYLVGVDVAFLVVSSACWHLADRTYAFSEALNAPVPVLAVPVTTVLFERGIVFFGTVSRFIFNRGTLEPPGFEYVNLEPDDDLSFWQKVQLALSNRALVILTAVFLVMKGVEGLRWLWETFFSSPGP